MKTFEIPEIELVKFNVEDVITTSIGDGDDLGDNQTPPAVRP